MACCWPALCSKNQPCRPSNGPTVTGCSVSSSGLIDWKGPMNSWTCSVSSSCSGPMAPLTMKPSVMVMTGVRMSGCSAIRTAMRWLS